MAIIIYSSVHATGNSQFGGVNDGLLSVTYQAFICGRVKMDATAPITSVINKLMINATGLNFLLLVVMIGLIVTFVRAYCCGKTLTIGTGKLIKKAGQ